MMLNHLDPEFLTGTSSARHHFLAETFRKAFRHRTERPFDPGTYPQVRDKRMLNRDFAREQAESIAETIDPALPFDPSASALDQVGETTHFSVMDARRQRRRDHPVDRARLRLQGGGGRPRVPLQQLPDGAGDRGPEPPLLPPPGGGALVLGRARHRLPEGEAVDRHGEPGEREDLLRARAVPEPRRRRLDADRRGGAAAPPPLLDQGGGEPGGGALPRRRRRRTSRDRATRSTRSRRTRSRWGACRPC